MSATYTDSNGIDWTYTITGGSTTTITATAVNGYAGAVVIPAMLGGLSVIAIGDNVLNGASDTTGNNITGVSFDNASNITSIGVGFCASVTSLSSLIIPDTVISIGNGLCAGSGVLSLTISKNVVNDGMNLTNLLLAAVASTIHLITPFILNDAFQSTSNLTTLYITSSNGNNSLLQTARPSYPFQNLNSGINGTLYVSLGISTQIFSGGGYGGSNNIGGGLPDSWSVLPFDGDLASGVVPCFVKGTRILTPEGYKPIQTFAQGDLVLTSEGHQVPVKFFAKRLHTTDSKTAPYHIPAHSFGHNRPSHDIYLSPDHAFLIRKGVWMTGRKGATLSDKVKQYAVIVYYHLECPNYLKDNLIIEGPVIVESYAGKQTNFTSPYTYSERLKGYTRSSTISSISPPTLQK
jgi:Hint domain